MSLLEVINNLLLLLLNCNNLLLHFRPLGQNLHSLNFHPRQLGRRILYEH